MLSKYFERAMVSAEFEPTSEPPGYFGSIEGFKGLWASGKTLEECREALRVALEDWVMVGLSMNHSLPSIDGWTPEVKKIA